jgi:hypothetical protein
MKILATIVLLVACGNRKPAPAGPTAQPTEPQAAPANARGTCVVSKDCGVLGGGWRCLRHDQGSHCFASPSKICDEPSCECFESDPCTANSLGTCTAYANGIATCTR